MATYGTYTDQQGWEHHYVTLTSKEDVSEEVLRVAEDIFDGWFSDEARIDWEDFLDRMDGTHLDGHGGRELDLGSQADSPAIRKIKAHINRIRREG